MAIGRFEPFARFANSADVRTNIVALRKEIADVWGTVPASEAEIEQVIELARRRADQLQTLRAALEVKAEPAVIIRLARELVGL